MCTISVFGDKKRFSPKHTSKSSIEMVKETQTSFFFCNDLLDMNLALN